MGKKMIFIGVASLLLILGLVASSLMGYLYIGWKNPKQKLVVSYDICLQDTISRYNDIVDNQNTGDEAFISKLASLTKDIEAKSDFTLDPDCVYMTYGYYELKGDSTKTQALYELLQGHLRDGRYINNSISGAARILLPAPADTEEKGEGAVG